MLASSRPYYATTVILLVTLLMVFLIDRRGVPMVVETNLENIPMRMGNYRAIEDSFSDSVYEELNADKHVYRHYIDERGDQIDLYIGYYGTAKGGRTGHNPYACLPGAGWGIIETKKSALDYRGKKVSVNLIIAQKGNVYETVLHWYQSNKDKVLASGIQQNFQRFVSRILHNRNDGAFVRISMQSNKNRIEHSFALVKEFAEAILAIIPNYWPVEH